MAATLQTFGGGTTDFILDPGNGAKPLPNTPYTIVDAVTMLPAGGLRDASGAAVTQLTSDSVGRFAGSALLEGAEFYLKANGSDGSVYTFGPMVSTTAVADTLGLAPQLNSIAASAAASAFSAKSAQSAAEAASTAALAAGTGSSIGLDTDGIPFFNAAPSLPKTASYREGALNTFAGIGSAAKGNPTASESNAGGYSNTAFGAGVLGSNVRGWKNTGVGESALLQNVDGYYNVAVGNSALENNSGGIGAAAQYTEAPGARNTAVGSNAMRYNTTGRGNVAMGRNAAHTNITGAYNTAVGTNAYSGTHDDGAAVYDEKTANYNTAVGYDAAFSTNANDNTAVGDHALYANTTGAGNTAIGKNSLLALTGGDQNTALGRSAGETSPANLTRATMLGYNAQVTGDYQVQVGGPSTTVYVYGTVQNRSDVRDKADVRDTALGLEFVEKLRPVDYRWDMRDDYRDADGTEHPMDGAHKGTRYHHGLIAQEVADVIAETGVDFGGFQDHTVNGGSDVMTIGYDELIAPLIKAVQELSAQVKELKERAK